MSRPTYRPTRVFFGAAECCRIEGRKYYLYGEDIAAHKFLRALALERQFYATCPLSSFLLPFRDDLRRVSADRPVAGLLMATRSRDPLVVRLALWLLGRCRSKAGIRAARQFMRAPDDAIRKEAVRALMRMGAWSELRAVAETERNERVRRYAVPSMSRTIGERLQHFGAGIGRRPDPNVDYEPSEMPYWAPGPLGPGRPARPSWLLARILARIRQLVHG